MPVMWFTWCWGWDQGAKKNIVPSLKCFTVQWGREKSFQFTLLQCDRDGGNEFIC